MRSAYLLVSHGSSDRRHQVGLSRLAYSTRQHLEGLLREECRRTDSTGADAPLAFHQSVARFRPLRSSIQSAQLTMSPIVETATLESAQSRLSQQIVEFAERVASQGVRQIIVVPLFLLAGVHVKDDLPEELAIARESFTSSMRLTCTPHLGSHSSLKTYVANRLNAVDADCYILLAHGSRRPNGNRAIQQLATSLGVSMALWSGPPNLETQVSELMQQDCRRIAIAPYFLFPGGITDAITRRTEELAEHFPRLSLRLMPPLGNGSELGQSVADLALSVPHLLPTASRSQDSERFSRANKGATA